MEVSEGCPSGDYWKSHIPSGTKKYYLSEPLKVLILKAAFLNVKAAHVVDYLQSRGVAFAQSEQNWNSLLSREETVNLVDKRICAAKQRFSGGPKGRTTTNTDYPEMIALFNMGTERLKFVIQECVKLPFFVQWYEKWEENFGLAKASFPERNMLAGKNAPTYIAYTGDDKFKRRLRAFRETISNVLHGEEIGSSGRKRKTSHRASGADVDRMNNGQMISYSDGQSNVWRQYQEECKQFYPNDIPLMPPEINEFIIKNIQKEGEKVEFLQAYLLDVKRDCNVKGEQSKKKGSQPTHIDIHDLHDETQQHNIAGCLYFNEKTISTTVYTKHGLIGSFNDDMNWRLVQETLWNDAPKGLTEKLTVLSKKVAGIENMNPLAWLQTCGLVLWASWDRRMPSKKFDEFGIMHFNADTPHCGPCFHDEHRLSYFFLAKRFPVKDARIVKEMTREKKKLSQKKKHSPKKNLKGQTSTKKPEKPDKLQISKEKFLLLTLDIMLNQDDTLLTWCKYLTEQFFCAYGESAVYGATDESLDWKGKSELKKAANAYAKLSMQVLDELESNQWENARLSSNKMIKALEAGCAQIEAYMSSKKARAGIKDVHEC